MEMLPGMYESRKFCQRGSNSDNVVFLVDERKEDPNTTKIMPSWMPFIECWFGSFVIVHGILTSIIDKDSYSFVIFHGVGVKTYHLDRRMCCIYLNAL